MGCNLTCMNGKLIRIQADKGGCLPAKRVANDFKILIIILDYLPLNALIRSSRANR
jgi:hypothetical protein